MSKTYRDRPAKERQITIKKHERGSHRRMDPYSRAFAKKSSWEEQQF